MSDKVIILIAASGGMGADAAKNLDSIGFTGSNKSNSVSIKLK